jgi:hypothetical protein
MQAWRWGLMVRDGADAPPHHEDYVTRKRVAGAVKDSLTKLVYLS